MAEHESGTALPELPREVLLDLLPAYASGEASAATRALVEAHLAKDPELARRLREASALPRAGAGLPAELELRALRRTRGALSVQRWLFGLATTFTALSLTSRIEFGDGGIKRFSLLIFDYPYPFGICLALAVAFWIAYVAVRRRLEAAAW
jgi:anti-sigma factor RsiW